MINTTYIENYKDTFVGLINSVLVPVLIALAFVVFLFGAYKYFIYGAADEKGRQTGRTVMLYGVIGFVLIFSLWGIVNVFMTTLNLGGETAPPPPTVGGGSAGGNRTVPFPLGNPYSNPAEYEGYGSGSSNSAGTNNICMDSSADNQGDPLPCTYSTGWW